MILRVVLACVTLALPAMAQDDLRDVERNARIASDQLIAVGDMLEAATLASDRVAALTETVRAYETGLMALRAGLRQVSLRERAMAERFEMRRSEISTLLGVLSTMERAPAPMLLLHPAGPIGTARSGQMIAEITPALRDEANDLRAELETLSTLRGLQTNSIKTLEQGLAGVQTARIELGAALAERRALPRRFVNDGAAMSALIQNADTLSGFADGLLDLPSDPIENADLKGLSLPVAGQIIRRFLETDAAGIRRPGWVIATPPGALVSTPIRASIRYAGPLLDYENVIILEPEQGALLVLAGLTEVYGQTGDILPVGSPVGVMGGALPSVDDFLTEITEGAGIGRTETLYIETRQAGGPVDPTLWFAQSQR